MMLLLLFQLTAGSHAMIAPPLTSFDDERQKKEIAMSRAIAERITYRVLGLMKTKSGAT